MPNVYSNSTGPRVALSDVLSTMGGGGIAVSASDALFSTGTVVLTGLGAATVDTAAGSIRISVPAQTNQTLSMSAVGNTTNNATQTVDARSIILKATNSQGVPLSVGYSNGSVVLSLDGPTGQVIASNGNTIAGMTTAINTSIQTAQFAASGNVSVGLSNGSLVISAMEGVLSNWFHNSQGLGSVVVSGQTNASASVVRIPVSQALSFSRVDILVSFQTASSATAATAAVALSRVAVLYSRSGATLNPIVGVSNTITASWVSNTGIASSVTGGRYLSFNLATSLSAGEYWLGVHVSTTSGISSGAATTALNATMSVLLAGMVASVTATGFGDFNAATNASSNPHVSLQGLISSAITATSQTLQQSQITQTGAPLARANLMVMLRNV